MRSSPGTKHSVRCRSLSSPALAGYKAVFAINVEVASSMIDVNVTPDKRTVFVQQEARLLDLLRSSLEDLWDPTKWQGAQSLANTSAPSQQSQCAPCMHDPWCCARTHAVPLEPGSQQYDAQPYSRYYVGPRDAGSVYALWYHAL